MKHSSLRVSPKELNFPPPLNRVITNNLKLQNTSTEYSIAYKVKTTAPQRYCVRPNTGVLPPRETVEVQVLLNYIKDAPPTLDCKDKFQIQSIILKDPHADVKEVWANAKEEDIVKQKLKARFSSPKSSTVENEDEKKLDDHGLFPTLPAAVIGSDTPANQYEQSGSKITTTDEEITKDLSISSTTPMLANALTTSSNTTPNIMKTAISFPVETPSGITLDTHATLRMAMDQVVAATNEKDAALQQNSILIERIKGLTEQSLKKERETNSTTVGLRQRNVSNLQQQQATALHTTTESQVRYDRLILFVISVLIAFILGRFSK